MFMIRNVSKILFGDSSKESIIEIPQGQLYIVRPLSVKGYSELIFKDAAASIRRTGQEFQYQLVIQRAYEEGEEELEEEEGDDGLGGLAEKDEKTFLLDESIRFRIDQRSTGENILAWEDLSGDAGDVYEFVCDTSVARETVQQFEIAAAHCQYERKYRKNHQTATTAELEQFAFDEEPVPTASPTLSPAGHGSPGISPSPSSSRILEAPGMAKDKEALVAAAKKNKGTEAPVSRQRPATREVLAEETAELHLFDFETATFVMQDAEVTASVYEIGDWKYWLQISSKAKDWLGQPVVEDINPVFNFEYLSFIFNHYTDDGSAYSWLLRFKDQKTEERFQEGLMQALWEKLNQVKWAKQKDDERDYVLEAFQDLTMEDADAKDQDEEEEDDEEDEEDEHRAASRPREEEYDSDESQDDIATRDVDGNVNSQLAVGYKHDRSFVVRGSKIGVFKHTPDNHLQFSTNISKVQTPNGKLFSPKKVMLHMEDKDMILQNSDNPNSLYRMDLEYGKVVDEWKVHDDIPVTTFAPENKFAQMSGEQTFLGLSNNALFRIDPRLADQKLVDSSLQQYAASTKANFTGAATTDKGYIAVASSKGDIRMFDRLGIRAKTQLPALGVPIVGIDVSKDGRWVLATTRTYLLLIDNQHKDEKNAGRLGFEKAFAKDAKPQPKRLALTPAHVAQFQHETKAPLSFTPARFNTGPDAEETTIVSATGPFIVTWSMKKVMRNMKEPYSIKRYSEEVKADNFRFGSDKSLIVALPNEVDMVARRALKRPTRESIAGEGLRTPVRRSGGRVSALRRDDIVNSPY